MFDRNENYWHSKFFNANTINLAVDNSLIIQDTYITNTISQFPVLVFDRKRQDFIQLHDTAPSSEQYAGGLGNNILYQNRDTLKIGGNNTSEYRSLVLINIKNQIESALTSINGFTAGMDYSVLNATLILTSSEGKTGGELYAFMLPTGVCTDESASWSKPTQSTNETWEEGGSIEPQSANILPVGQWNGHDVSFDITPFMNIWSTSSKSTIGIAIKGTQPPTELLEFHSQQAVSPLIGSRSQTNVVFLGAGSNNYINTDGIVVKLSQESPYITIESAETQQIPSQRWSAFNASVSIGDTFSMFLPDIKTSANTYTLIDKRNSTNGVQMVVSGDTGGISSTVHTAAEFISNGKVASGYGIAEFTEPDNSFITDISTINPNDTIFFDYIPTVSPNNAKSFTVDFYSDERVKNNRIRLYLKEQTSTENRTSLYTDVKRISVKPRLFLTLSV